MYRKRKICETLDDWGHPVTIKILKQFAQSVLPRQCSVGEHWSARFLNRNTALTAKFSPRLDRQRADAKVPMIGSLGLSGSMEIPTSIVKGAVST